MVSVWNLRKPISVCVCVHVHKASRGVGVTGVLTLYYTVYSEIPTSEHYVILCTVRYQRHNVAWYSVPLWAATKKLLEVVSCKKLSANVIWFRGAQLQCSRSPGRLIFVGPHCGTCFVSHFCRLQFWGGYYICGKLVDFWSNLLTDISSYVVWNAWPYVVDKKFQ